MVSRSSLDMMPLSNFLGAPTLFLCGAARPLTRCLFRVASGLGSGVEVGVGGYRGSLRLLSVRVFEGSNDAAEVKDIMRKLPGRDAPLLSPSPKLFEPGFFSEESFGHEAPGRLVCVIHF